MDSHAAIRKLEPTPLWSTFVDLNAVPRPSKKEEAVSKFVADRGRKLGLETKTDSLGNVLICKPASPGYEKHPTVVLQSHIDMVCQKNSDTDFDFDTQGIQMRIDGDWVKAIGTTLGADNGIGVATAFAALESTTIKHPPLECLFTIDEETGMTGAKELDPTWLIGKVLLNLDTEADNELTIGCAGGANVTASLSYQEEDVPKGWRAIELEVRGLTGGHSGMDIHRARGNANKIMNAMLMQALKKFDLRISSIDGGSLRNAIPRESVAQVFIPKAKEDDFAMWIMRESLSIRMAFPNDPQMLITCSVIPSDGLKVLPKDTQESLLGVVKDTLSGVIRMSPSIPDLVQTSNNLARVSVGKGEIALLCLTRSSVDSERDLVTEDMTYTMQRMGAKVVISDQYPGWQPLPSSNIVKLMSDTYRSMFNEEAHVSACHAGLECGIIGAKFPGMEMISFGPNIVGAHSPDERVQISSVQKFYGYFVEVLSRL